MKQLQCFLTLSQQLNYGKTARLLNMTQPTISFQIKSLEDAFGARLFERDRQQVRLTDAGIVLREHAQTILDTVSAVRDRLNGLHTRLRLRVSYGPVGQMLLLPAVIRALAQDHPGFELEICEHTTEQNLTRLPAGEVDALLMTSALPIPGMRFDLLSQEAMVAMVSSRSPLAAKGSISVRDLQHVDLIASRLSDCRFHQPFLNRLLAPFGVTPRFRESPSACAIQFAYVAAGEGVVLTTESLMDCHMPGIAVLPFQEPLPKLQLGLCSMEANETLALSIFRKVVLDCAQRLFGRKAAAFDLPHIPAPMLAYADKRRAG